MSASGRAKRSEIAPLSGAGAAPAAASAASAAPHVVARLVVLDPGFYAFSLAAETTWHESVAGFALPAVQVCPPPHQNAAVGGKAVEITDSFGRAGSWLGGRHRMLFVKSPAGGGAALVTGYLAGDPDGMKLELEIRRFGPPATVMTLTLVGPGAGPVSAGRSPQPVGLEVVAHIRGRGDIRFLDTPWIGRLGPGLWIEAFIAKARSAAAAIEYKGLAAGGAETPWIETGGLCGARGRGIPLIGFAVRQKSGPGGALFDCEYTGYFESGATVGARNGAPCRSTIENDPLEGMQLRITARPARPGRVGFERARQPASETPTRRPIA